MGVHSGSAPSDLEVQRSVSEVQRSVPEAQRSALEVERCGRSAGKAKKNRGFRPGFYHTYLNKSLHTVSGCSLF